MIKRLYVHNFRCLENFTLDFGDNRSALLIGRNGAGKSTVLDALRVLQSICRGPNRVSAVVRARDFARLDRSRPMRFEVDAILAESKYSYSVAFEWPAEFHEARVMEESLSKDGAAVFTRQQAQVQLAGGAGFGLDWHVFALPVINERPPDHSIRDVKAFFANMFLIEPIPQQMKGFSEEPASELDSDAENFASCLRAILQRKPKAYSEFDAFVRELMPDFSSIENADRGKEGGSQLAVTFEQRVPHRTLVLDFDVLSAGEKCLLISAYVTAASAVRSHGDPPVLCAWDEPDSHLSISEVGQFIMAMRKMAERGGQLLVTSHHPETIRKFSDESTFVLTRKSHLEPTVMRPLGGCGYSGDLINALVREEIIG
ncbi:AAA family ATPase [Candidatus Poribacteria bacterium]|nr:AAA family ATPase [Candidatus Poribacteria bacterium]